MLRFSGLVPLLLAPLFAVVGVGANATADEVGCGGEPATIAGTPGNDTMVGTDGDDVVWLDAGDDVFHGRGGDDHVCGGPGADQLFGEDGRDWLEDAGTNEVIIAERDLAAPQRAEGDDAADVLDGGPGNDWAILTQGDDSASGGEGDDLLSFHSQGPVAVDAAAGVAEGDGVDTFSGFETYSLRGSFVGSERAESVYAHGVADLVLGGGADSAYVSGAEDASVDGGAGADRITMDRGRVDGGPGRDQISVRYLATIHAGPGNDHVSVPKPRAHELHGGLGRDRVSMRVHHPMVIDLRERTVRYTVAGVQASVVGFEAVVAGEGDDVVRGTGRDERLQGFTGNDRLLGGGGADRLIGGPGDRDRADGGAGRDRCKTERTRSCEQ